MFFLVVVFCVCVLFDNVSDKLITRKNRIARMHVLKSLFLSYVNLWCYQLIDLWLLKFTLYYKAQRSRQVIVDSWTLDFLRNVQCEH